MSAHGLFTFELTIAVLQGRVRTVCAEPDGIRAQTYVLALSEFDIVRSALDFYGFTR